VSVLLIEQKLPVALRIADRCLVMGHGRVVFAGAPAALPAATMAAFLTP
jgi:branched-chain amino acid transport system ATP-binding protein